MLALPPGGSGGDGGWKFAVPPGGSGGDGGCGGLNCCCAVTADTAASRAASASQRLPRIMPGTATRPEAADTDVSGESECTCKASS